MPVGAPKGTHKYKRHGLSHTRIDNIYKSMISRCYKPNNNRYQNYGGKGIIVCEEWLSDKTKFFEWAFENGYDDTLTIDRIDTNGNYEPSNCRWATYTEQANNKTSNHTVSINGVTHTLSEWSRISGIKMCTISWRIHHGWPVQKAIWGGLYSK